LTKLKLKDSKKANKQETDNKRKLKDSSRKQKKGGRKIAAGSQRQERREKRAR